MTDVQRSFFRLAPHLVDFTPDADGVRQSADRRFVFFETRMFAQLFEDMRTVTGPIIDSKIQEFGENAGKDIASKMDKAFRDTGLLRTLKLFLASGFDYRALAAIGPTDNKTMIQKIFGLGTFDGWLGTVTITEYDEEMGRMVARAENTFESYSYGEDSEAQCWFMQGVLKGILAYYWDAADLRVHETTCRCDGADACRMVVAREA